MSLLWRGLLIVAVVLSGDVVRAQTYPTRPITLVVPYPAGGGTDFFARLVGGKMSELIGQPVVIENKPGAATNLGADFVAKAAPDGYTILLGDVATYAANPSLYKKIPFDPDKDFAPISLTARFLTVLVVNPAKLKINSVAELIEAASKAPGGIDIAHAGVGNPFHLAAVLFEQAAKIKLNQVPYRGAGPAVQALIAGEVPLMFVDYATARSHLSSGNLKALAVAAQNERPELPGVPPVAQTPGLQGFEAWPWQGLAAPANTPAPSSPSCTTPMRPPSRMRWCARSSLMPGSSRSPARRRRWPSTGAAKPPDGPK